MDLDSFVGKRILVIGDVMLDKYIVGTVNRISPEAPVQVVDVKSEKYIPRGAANVASNVASLGGIPVLVSMIGDDVIGKHLSSEIKDNGVTIDGLIIDKNCATIQKVRIIAHQQQLVRIDYEQLSKIDVKVLIDKLSNIIVQADIILVSDAKNYIIQAIEAKSLLNARCGITY
ncbi:TPA: hypothetical protein HA235_07810 [Candidatus Woesearchaeota archaeon]|nr:hypothetical protein [Candidatus Woesearchaeota archaeon]HIH32584.1 hypothetical protein [Candidatus Woesearchaeota archaeon]HIH54747.1 hypothetical protein [Candidatus Woesearchaeota archaeon]HIJ02099.1 hypothetical protein [Candidatus Woesearchaeota archaeon]HIJ14702.1 hypothetical protein [Candidatus Woesearchaeota archaeon]